jgi:GABA permease
MSSSKRLLILAGTAVADLDELPPSVRALVDAADAVFVVTPTLASRLEWLVSDVDKARHAADARLDTVLEQLRSADVAAEGAVGDDTPLTAIEDHVRSFNPDHILIALRSSEHADWQERRLVERVEQRFGLPMTLFAIDPEGHVAGGSADG